MLLEPLPLTDVRGWADKHIVWLGNNRSKNTAIHYAGTLTRFADWCDAADGPMKPSLVEDFCQRPRGARAPEPKPATYNRDLAAVRLLFKWLINYEELAIKNPAAALDTRDPHNEVPRTIDDHVWAKVWHSKLLTDEERVWLGLMYYAGLRRSEVDTITVGQIKLGTEEIVGFTRKGGGSYVVEYGAMADLVCDELPHLSYLVPEWKGMVADLVRGRGRHPELPLVPRAGCGVDINHTWVNRDLREVLVRIGLAENAFSPHCMRHTCATNLMKAHVGIEFVATCLGHANIQTTRRYQNMGGALKRLREDRSGR